VETEVKIDMLRRTPGAALLATLAVVLTAITAGAQGSFPYEQEMVLDARPMPGGKRVPLLEVMPDGRAQVDLWCKSGPALVTVVDDTIVFTLGPMPEASCTPERARADEEMANALSQVTQWRVEGDALVLVGPTTLRFHTSSH
jgi:hypothetical protein